MSAAIICDNCNTVLPVDSKGDDVDGERAGWLVIEAGGLSWDLCTRSCAVALLENAEGPLVEILEAWQTAVAEVARIINEDDDE